MSIMNKLRILFSQLFIILFGKRTRLISDELFNRVLFFLRTGRKANLKNPETFNENVLARKVYCDEYDLSFYTDKYEVRKYIEEKIGKEYVVPALGLWNSVDEIDFSALPQSFVLKATHGSGWNVVVKDKSRFVPEADCKKLKKALNCNYYHKSREKNYRDIQPRILCEKYVSTENEKGLIDFKVYCFNGKAGFFEVTYTLNDKIHQTLFYPDFSLVGMKNGREEAQIDSVVREKKDKIISLAEMLACEFEFVRVDFYIADENIFFSELTFHSGGGIRPINPEKVDRDMGSFFEKGGKA